MARSKHTQPMEIQSVLFSRDHWTLEKARSWLRRKALSSRKVDRTIHHLRFRQQDPKKFKKSSFRTKKLGGNMALILGKKK